VGEGGSRGSFAAGPHSPAAILDLFKNPAGFAESLTVFRPAKLLFQRLLFIKNISGQN
jgi:hypothetical protein